MVSWLSKLQAVPHPFFPLYLWTSASPFCGHHRRPREPGQLSGVAGNELFHSLHFQMGWETADSLLIFFNLKETNKNQHQLSYCVYFVVRA